ncbi:MAG: restriction endonuclease subunit S [Muribaculaceae bacterium]|nr:restriction endonuclease subunit S [Muribaculaceae bacterium]
MSEWKKVKLGELYEVHNGLSKGRQFFGTGYPFLTFSTVFNNWFLPKSLDSLVQSSEKEREACSIKRGDVFITRTSETMDELGMSSVALKDYPNATYNGFTKRLRPTTDEVVPKFIGYYLRSKKFRGKFMAFSSMTTRASLANDDLLSMEVELPEKAEQIRIATILSHYDSLIENYQKQIKLLEEAAQRLYKEWFVDLRFPGHQTTKIVDGMPEGWISSKLGQLAEFKRGKTITKKEIIEGSIPVVAGGLEPAYYCNKSNTAERVITVSGSGANAGFTRLYYEKVWASDCSYVDIDTTPFLHFVYCYLKENKTTIDNMQKGSAQPHVYAKDINALELSVPDKKNLEIFESKASMYYDNVASLLSQIHLLTEARDRLLPKLMSGNIDV